MWVSKQLWILRWFGTCWEKCKKLANKKVTGKRSVQNWSLYSSILLTFTSFWQKIFSVHFFKLFPQIWNQRKILHFFDTHMLKKKKNFWGHGVYEYFLEIVECKFARNGLTNWKKIFTNIFKNIIWHLFAGESHQVVKITVPYWIVPSSPPLCILSLSSSMILTTTLSPLRLFTD